MRTLLVALSCMGAFASISSASPPTISFSGTADTEYASNGFPTIPTGTPLTGVITYYTSEIASPACCGGYKTAFQKASDSVMIQIGKYTFSASGTNAFINYYSFDFGTSLYDVLNVFDNAGSGWNTNISGLPGPVFGGILLRGQDGFVAIQANLPAPNPSLFDPSLDNLLTESSLCATVPGTIDCSAVVDLHITSITLASAPEPSSAGLAMIAGLAVLFFLKRGGAQRTARCRSAISN